MHKCENDDFFIIQKLNIFDKYANEWDEYEINFCPLCGKNLQPDRLNPEGALSVCDSPNTEYK